MFFKDEETGIVYALTDKGMLVVTLMEMVPGLSVDDAERLVRQLIEDAVDAADLSI
jgi:hypothetical protein